MEDQLVQLLANTQLSEQGPRQQAEIELKRARSNPAFPLSLANIASHTSIDTSIRQSALSNLRIFIEKNWSDDEADDEPALPIADDVRGQLKQVLLDLCLSPEGDRKVKLAASYAAGKIAVHDFPEQWPNLLPTILAVIPTGTDAQLHGALRVLSDLIDESLSEDQFFSMARDITKVLTQVALDENRKPMLRALAISTFRGCFDLMNMIKEDHAKEVKAFADELLTEWNPFFITVLASRLPEADLTQGSQPDSWNSIIALKLQVVKTLLRIRRVFPNLLLPQCTTFFRAVWEELTLMQVPHEQLYINQDAQGRLEDSDSLPYTLDFLVLEELDFLNQCFRAPPVQAELDGQLQGHASAHEVPWMMEIMKMLVGYSRVTREEEDLWDIDCSLYLAEETSVTANYTARTAAGDLLIKMGEWFDQKTIDGLFGYTKTLFTGEGSWRSQEAALYLFVMLASDFHDMQKPISNQVAHAYLELVNYAINRPQEPLLGARGYLVAGVLCKFFETPVELLDRIITCITREESEVVQVACVKAAEGLTRAGRVTPDRQIPIINSIQTYMNNKDPSDMEDADELLYTLAEALRAAIKIDTRIALSNDVQSVDLLFRLAQLGASNFQVTMIVSEAFEEIVGTLSNPESYAALCSKILPTLTGAFDVANLTEDNPLVTVAVELLAVLAEHGSEPLPPGFVAATFPKLNRLLMESTEGEVLRPGCETVKWILQHDHQQVFNWQDGNGRSGLEVCLHIIDRLLGSSIEDNSASEVGGLAAELVEKAGQEERLSALSSLGFPPLGAAHASLSLHPNASSPPSTTAGMPSLPIPDPRSAEELAQWNQYLVKLGEQVASSVYAHALGLAPPPPPPPQQYLDPTALAQFGLAGMPGLLGLGLGLGGLPGLGMLGAAAGGLGGVDYNAIAAYQQAQAQALAVQSQIAAGLYPGLDLASLAAAAAANPAHAHAAAAAAAASASNDDAKHAASPPRRPASSSSRRSASASESDFEFDALRPSRAHVPPPVIPGLAGLPGFGPAGAGMGLGDKRSVVPLKSAPPPVKEEDEDAEMDDAEAKRLPPLAPIEPRLGMRTPGMPARIPASNGGSSGLYPTLPPSLSTSSTESSGEKITLPGIQSLLEPSFRLRPVASSPSSSSENEDEDDETNSTATSRAGSPSASGGTVLPSFASIALNDSRPANKDIEERMQHIAVIQAMIVAVNREWVAKHGPAPSHAPVEERKLEVSRDVEMVA